jgi:RimJ/RimL family protein N-acetyltransferase
LSAIIKENVYPNIGQLKLRPLTVNDYREFRLSVLESKESMSTFLDMGIQLPDLNVIDFMNNYSAMLKDEKFEHFGVFHGYKMLGYASFCEAFDPSGIQIVYWVRESYLKQNIGTWLIGNMKSKAWLERNYHFSQLAIDKANYASRRIAKKMGFEPLYAMSTLNGQGTMKTGTYIIYISLNPSLKLKAACWDKRAVDLIGHPCMIDKFHHLIHDEIVNEHYRWKSPIYKEDDLNGDGSFKDWHPVVDVNDPSNSFFD